MIANAMNQVFPYNSLAAMFLAQAQRYGGKVLYRFSRDGQWRSLTWKEALVQVREIALGLVSLGIDRGDRVAIFASNRVEWLLADWANICIGALTVPIYAASTTTQARHIIEHADPAFLFVDSPQRLAGLELHASPADQLKSVIVIEGERSRSGVGIAMPVLTLDRLREIGRAYAVQHEGIFENLAQSVHCEDDLTIIYTSGTTGTPKGVRSTHANYLYMIGAVDAAVPSSDADVTLHFLPTAHSLGRLEHFMAVAKGWTLAIARSVETIPSDLRTICPTVIFSVPRIYEQAYNRIRLRLGRERSWRRKLFYWALAKAQTRLAGERHDWSSALTIGAADLLIFSRVRSGFGGRVRVAISGGAPLSPEIAGFFHALGMAVLEGYGLTETSTVSHVNRPEHFKLGTVGLPLAGMECRVAEDGEILLRGPNIFKAYFRDLLATQEAIDAEGWFHTGDVGAVDADGFLHVTERKRDLIVTSGGKKVAPQKLENLLKSNPLISQALIVGRGQRHVLALITLDVQRVRRLAEQSGIEIDQAVSLAAHPWVQAQVREIIQKTNKVLAPYEAIRNFTILDRDFTIEGEELTPTLKPRRQVIVERYKELIEDMYRKAS
jgi:long-chain acyl-CoA synthetase